MSDWSSDVCSSDLLAYQKAFALLEGLGLRPESVGEIPVDNVRARLADPAIRRSVEAQGAAPYLSRLDRLIATGDLDDSSRLERSEERRVGKACVSTCRSRWSPSH